MAKATGNKDGSVAPKERINIRYRAETGDQQEDVELPMKFLVLGDYTGRESEETVEEREPVNVDKENFDAVLASHDVQAQFTVPNELAETEGAGADGDEISVSLKFDKMRDFTPDAICQQVPELRKLIELREALSTFKGPLGNIPAFRKRLEALLDDPEAQRRLMAELGLGDDAE